MSFPIKKEHIFSGTLLSCWKGDIMGSIQQKTQAIILVDRCLSLVAKKGLDYSEQCVKELIHENRRAFKKCNNVKDIIPLLQQAILTKEIKGLLEEAELDWPAEYARNLASNWEDVFRGCETREDAIQRLKELDAIIN